MKKILVILLFIVLAASCASAQQNDSVQQDNPTQPDDSAQLDDSELQADYVRRHAERGITIILSRNELREDYDVRGLYEKYSDDFFAENFLIYISIHESNFNTWHTLERIDEDGNIVINRFVPYIGLRAERTSRLIIERSNSERLEEYRIVFNSIYMEE